MGKMMKLTKYTNKNTRKDWKNWICDRLYCLFFELWLQKLFWNCTVENLHTKNQDGPQQSLYFFHVDQKLEESLN
jgi:hypothetical protein